MRITGTDLEQWADRLDSRDKLPILVRRLIYASTEDVRFPGGEGVQKPGFDGRVHAEKASADVPEGHSVWELGCGKDPRSKANADYAKRSEHLPDGFDPKEHTFVFVTPRRWYDGEAWALERAKDGIWREIRVHDADTLEQWLERSPAVAAWFSDEIGKPRGVQALESFWEEWSIRTEPPTSAGLVRAGREDAEQTLFNWLAGAPSLLSTQLDELGEAAAFVYAVACVSERTEALLNRTIVVDNDEALRQLAPTAHPLVVVALGVSLGIAKKAAQTHRVLLATRSPVTGSRITLGALDGGAAVAALERMGIPSRDAEALAHDARGRLPDLRRRLGDAPPPPNPELIELAPLLLVDGWSEREGSEDLAVVMRVLGATDPSRLANLVRRFKSAPDSLFVSDRDLIRWGSRRTAWQRLAQHLGSPDLDRFKQVFPSAVLDEGASESLKKGMVEAALLLGAASEDLDANSIDGQRQADGLVFSVLDELDRPDRWASVDRYLPALAEAAPGVFLKQIQERLGRDESLFASLLREDDGRGFLGARTAVGLVAALQVLAWSPQYFAESALLLSELAALDPGANAYPRPMSSLEDILVPWLPHTMANPESRRGVVAAIAKRRPQPGVRLALDLLAKMSTSTTALPRLRPWCAGWKEEGVPRGEWAATCDGLGDVIVETVEGHPALWATVLDSVRDLPRRHRDLVFDRLAGLDVSTLAEDERESLRTAVRAKLHEDIEWDDEQFLLGDERESIAKLYARLTPEDPRQRHEWLFAHRVELPDLAERADWRRYSAHVGELQLAAVAELVAELDGPNLLAFAREGIEDRVTFGCRVAEEAARDAIALELAASCLEDRDPWARDLRRGLFVALERRRGLEWLDELLAHQVGVDRGEVLLGLNPRPEVWALLGQEDGEAARWYWSRVDPNMLSGQALEEGIAAFLRSGRALEMIAVAAMRPEHEGFSLSAATVDTLLRKASEEHEQTRTRRDANLGYYVSKLLDALERATDVDAGAVADHEYRWLDVIARHRQPNALFARLGAEPERFVALVCAAFRAASEDWRAPTDELILEARRAGRVLWHWRGVPGAGPSGVDERHLRRWVAHARDRLRELDRAVIGDQTIGQVLSHAPTGDDGNWPHEAVREVLESLNGVSQIRKGFRNGRVNQRGVFTKSFGEGGDQERSIAASYRRSADALRVRWPITATFLDDIARVYDSHAKDEDDEAKRTQLRFPPHARVKERVAAYLDDIQGQGRHAFTREDVASGVPTVSEGDLDRELAAMVQSQHLASPEPGFFVVVPPERRTTGLPPSWYVDDWMRWKGVRYHVGLLTAAAQLGAGHEQPTTFQVVVERPLDGVTVQGSRIAFVAGTDAGGAGTREVATQTGAMRMSGPERTLFDLVAHAEEVGGVDLVAVIAEDLGEDCDAEVVAALADSYPLEVSQRLGWILEKKKHRGAIRFLEKHVEARAPEPVPLRLRSASKRGRRAKPPWQVSVDAALERDR